MRSETTLVLRRLRASCLFLLPLALGVPAALGQVAGGTVKSLQKLSATSGGLGIALGYDDHFGHAAAGVGDLDGDSVGDVAIGESHDDDGGSNAGALWIVFLNANGTAKSTQKISSLAGGLIGPLAAGDEFASAIASIGDLDGDGVTDLAVGAWGDDDGAGGAGAVWILFLNANGTVKAEQKISATAGGFTGTLLAGDGFGIAVDGLDDLDGDGVPDLVVGARFDDDGGYNRGAAYILFLNPNGTVKGHQKISDIAGGLPAGLLADDDVFGNAVVGLGDVDGDNVEDILVGAMQDDDGGNSRGAVYVLFLNPNGTVKSQQKISDTAGNFTAPLANNVQFGSAAGAMGDFDLDGTPDVMVGARLDGPSTPGGAAYWLYLNPNGTVKGHTQISRGDGGFTGTIGPGDEFGNTLTALGDLDGDGATDVCVAAWLDDDGASAAGAAYILLLNSFCQNAVAYGKGCPGSGGFVPHLSTPDCPAIGVVLNLHVDSGLGGTTCMILFGWNVASIPMGIGSCELLLTPVLPLIITIPMGGAGPGNGSTVLSGMIPASASGVVFSMQAFCLDPGAIDGYCNSNALKLTIP